MTRRSVWAAASRVNTPTRDRNTPRPHNAIKTRLLDHAGATLGIDVEVVSRNAEKRGFHVVKRRWVVERGLGWLMRHRRLARDYETLPAGSEAMIHVASIDNFAKRITGDTIPTWQGAC